MFIKLSTDLVALTEEDYHVQIHQVHYYGFPLSSVLPQMTMEIHSNVQIHQVHYYGFPLSSVVTHTLPAIQSKKRVGH